MKTISRILTLVILISLSACGAISDFLAEETPPPVEPTVTPAPTPTRGTLGIDAPITLKIWVAPEFDPEGESEAAAILHARLDEYSQLHPGVRVDARVKDIIGPASTIESLRAADTAAPLALPDLVLLTTEDSQIAAAQNLIYALELEENFTFENDWYQFAEGLTTYNDQIFGVPFAADAIVMVYRSSQTENPPTTWGEFLEQGQRLMFPASSPEAMLSILLYLSEDGQLSDETGKITLESAPFENVMTFYNQAQTSNLMPYWITQLDSDQGVWDYFTENRGELAVTWMSRYLQETNEQFAAGLIPTRSGASFTLTNGFVWSVATPNTDRQEAAEDLALFLSDPAFTGIWTESLGYLPVRPSALAIWEPGPEQSLASVVLPSAVPAPDFALVSQLGPIFQQAANAILKQELSASEAAAQAVNQVNN